MSEEDELFFPRPTDIDEPSNFFLDYIDTITEGTWSIALPMLVFGITYLSLNEYNPKEAFAAASFATMISVVFLLGLGLLQSQALILVVVLVALAVVINRGGRI